MKKYFTTALALVVLAGCDTLFLDRPASDPESVFENLWKTFDEEYARFEERDVDWNELYARYRPMVAANSTDTELFNVLAEMLSHLDDSHVGLTAPHQPYFNANRIYREKVDADLFDLNIIRENYLDAGSRRGHDYLYGNITGTDIAYIHFGQVSAEVMSMLPQMLDGYPDAAGYIIDLRRNSGGNHTFAFDNMGRFTDRPRYVFRSNTKNGPGRQDYSPWYEWHLKPSRGYISRPIVVLTDRYTPSAAERMVMAFKTLPNAIVMGDTTSGTHGTKIPRELANGWYFTLSVQKVEMFDGKSYEGLGLAPDVVVKNDASGVKAGVDRVLQTAIDQLVH